ncbi:MAG TPA: cupredoxin domain-containing protein, partial [Nitrospirota bacterium]
ADMRNIKYTVIALTALVLLGGRVFGQETAQTAGSAAPAEPAKQEAKHDHTYKEKRFVATIGADGVQRVEITGGDYYFDPNYIIVKVNKPVEFVVKKAPGYVPHDMVVKAPEAGINFVLNLEKEAQTVKFTPTKVGKYEMSCDKKLLFFKSHKDRGMHGMIEVVE